MSTSRTRHKTPALADTPAGINGPGMASGCSRQLIAGVIALRSAGGAGAGSDGPVKGQVSSSAARSGGAARGGGCACLVVRLLLLTVLLAAATIWLVRRRAT
jgi:hypothetical protein